MDRFFADLEEEVSQAKAEKTEPDVKKKEAKKEEMDPNATRTLQLRPRHPV